MANLIEILKGGKGSGDWGHKGRPGKRGGSSGMSSFKKTLVGHDVFLTKDKIIGSIVDHDEKTITINSRGKDTTYNVNDLHLHWPDALYRKSGSASYDAKPEIPYPKKDVQPATSKKIEVAVDKKALNFLSNYAGKKDIEELSDAAIGKIKKKTISDLSSMTGISKEKISDVLRSWDSVSEPTMVHFSYQETIGKEFSSLSNYQKDKLKIAKAGNAKPILDKSDERILVRAMYDKTQKDLASHGYSPNDTMTLYRGFVSDSKKKLGNTAYGGNSVESWSVLENMAGTFAEGVNFDVEQPTGIGHVLKANVKIKDIFSTPGSGFGAIPEGEFVIFGSNLSNVEIIESV